MTPAQFLLYGAAAMLLAVATWSLFCNERTLRQRRRLLHALYTAEHLSLWSCVSYDAHLWHLVTFRDPMRLYDAKVRAAVSPTGATP